MVSIVKNDRKVFFNLLRLQKGDTSIRDAFMPIVQEIKKINGHLMTIAADVVLQGGALEQVKMDRSCRLCQAEEGSDHEAEGSWSDTVARE